MLCQSQRKTKMFHHKHSKQKTDLCSGQQRQQKCSESITADCVLDVISALIFNDTSPYM